jgi:DNA polymerase (family 10)
MATGKLSTNQEISCHLKLISQLIELDGGNSFQVKAFREAAIMLTTFTVPLNKLHGESALGDVKGIGTSIQTVIKEYLETGTSARLQDLGTRWPLEAMTMTRVSGVGAKTALKFHEEGIKNFGDLVLAAKEGKLKEKMASAVLAADRFDQGRIPHDTALYLAAYVVENLPGLIRVQVCGSLRRNTLDSKDVDIVAIPLDGTSRADVYAKFAELGEVINVGDSKSSIRVEKYGVMMQVDLWLVDPSYWGSALVYATGSKDHCVALRTLAKSRGMTINEYGIFEGDYPSGKKLGGQEEEDIYKILGIKMPTPENRTNILTND